MFTNFLELSIIFFPKKEIIIADSSYFISTILITSKEVPTKMKAILSKKHYIQLIILETYLANGQVTVQQLEETTQATNQTILKQLNELENRGFFQVEKKKIIYC